MPLSVRQRWSTTDGQSGITDRQRACGVTFQCVAGLELVGSDSVHEPKRTTDENDRGRYVATVTLFAHLWPDGH